MFQWLWGGESSIQCLNTCLDICSSESQCFYTLPLSLTGPKHWSQVTSVELVKSKSGRFKGYGYVTIVGDGSTALEGTFSLAGRELRCDLRRGDK